MYNLVLFISIYPDGNGVCIVAVKGNEVDILHSLAREIKNVGLPSSS
jgi:hypothetical protein